MNHSCAASCGGSELGFEVALRDIEAGEELTNDYATMYMRPRERFDCRCGARSCRLVVSNAATHEAVAAMRHQVRRAIVGLDLVEQPLLALLRRDTLTWATEELDRAVERDVAVPMSRPPA